MNDGYLKKSLFSFLSQILLIVLGMGAGILVARMLGPDLKGKAALLTNAVQMLFMFGGLGLGSSFAYFIARRSYAGRMIVSFAFTSSIVLGALAIAVFLISFPLHKSIWQGIPNIFVFATCLLTVLYLLNNFLGRIISAYDQIYETNIIQIISSLFNFILLLLLLVILGMKLKGFIVSLYLVAMLQFILFIYVLRKQLKPVKFFETGIISNSISYGLKSYALLTINFLNYRIDMFLLKYFKNDLEVGYYSLAVGMAELLWLVPNSTIAPLFNRVAGGDGQDRSVLTVKTCRWSLYFLLFIAVVSIFYGRYFIELLYGSAYIPSYEPFIWILPGICLFPIYKLLIVDLAARGMPGYGTVTSIVALVMNVGANLVLIPRFGTIGAAASSSISYTIMSVLSLFFFIKVSGMSVKEIFVPGREEFLLLKKIYPSANCKQLSILSVFLSRKCRWFREP